MGSLSRLKKLSGPEWVLVVLFVFSLPFVTPHIDWDGTGYYGYLRSLMFDHNLQFKSDWTPEKAPVAAALGKKGLPHGIPITKTGHLANYLAVGPAMLWAPFVAATRGAILVLHGKDIPGDGHGPPYTRAVCFASALYAFWGLWISFRLARSFVEEKWALVATVAIWFGSPLPVYMYTDPSWAHADCVFVVALFLWYWHRTRNGRSGIQWVIWGLISGLMCDVYFPNSIFLLLPALELVLDLRAAKSGVATRMLKDPPEHGSPSLCGNRENDRPTAKAALIWCRLTAQLRARPGEIGVDAQAQSAANPSRWGSRVPRGVALGGAVTSLLRGVAFATAFIVAFLPTMIVRQIIFGSPFATGAYSSQPWNWTSPHFGGVLFASSHGAFTTTPILIIAVAGLFLLWRSHPSVGGRLMLLAVGFWCLIAVYPWWNGLVSFGSRFFVSLTPIFVIGLAVAFEKCTAIWHDSRAAMRRAVTISALLIVWNLGLVYQLDHGLFMQIGPVDWQNALYNEFRTVPGMVVQEISAKFSVHTEVGELARSN